MSALPQEIAKPLRLDLGCGKNKREGFTGVDSRAFEGVDLVLNLVERPPANVDHDMYDGALTDAGYFCWPWADSTVEEVHCSHFLEHLTAPERIHFANELHRVLKPGAKATIITPHAFSVRAYGDLTHQWPPVVSFWYDYLNKAWRESQAPHNDFYTCDFDRGYGFGLHPSVQARNVEYQNYAVVHLLEGAQDLHVTLTKR